MNSANANDDGTVRELAEAQREEISHSHTHTHTHTAANAFSACIYTLKHCDIGQQMSLKFKDAKQKNPQSHTSTSTDSHQLRLDIFDTT